MKNTLSYTLILSFFSIIIWSCTEDVENFTLPEKFANYKDWTKLEEYQGAKLSGQAHGANDLRKIFINKANDNLENDDELPIGTILMKEINGGGAALFGMEKKSKGANSWEYWDLKAGINLGTTNDCQSCHEEATTDYIFSVDDF